MIMKYEDFNKNTMCVYAGYEVTSDLEMVIERVVDNIANDAEDGYDRTTEAPFLFDVYKKEFIKVDDIEQFMYDFVCDNFNIDDDINFPDEFNREAWEKVNR